MTRTSSPRFTEYGLYDAHTGALIATFATRRKAIAAKDSAIDPHRMRVRGKTSAKFSLWKRLMGGIAR